MQQQKFDGWKVVIALGFIYGLNIAFTTYAAGVIGKPMLEDLHMSRSIFGMGATVIQLMIGFAAPLVAMVLYRIGTRYTLTLGSLGIAASAFLMATFASEGWHYVLGFGVGIGLASAFGTLVPAQTCAASWFTKKRGFAVACVMAASGIGGFISAPLLRWVIALCGGSWRAGWYFVTGMTILSAIIAFTFVRNRPSDLGQVPDGVAADDEPTSADAPHGTPAKANIYRSPIDWPVSLVLRCPANWFITLSIMGFYVPITVFIAHGVLHLTDLGHSPAVAAFALAMLAICSTLGKLAGGFLCDRIEPQRVWFVSQVMIALGIGMVTIAHTQATIYLVAILLGAGYGGGLVCWPTIVANYFGAKSLPAILGVQFPINAVFSSTGPLLVGVAFDAMGSYVPAFIAISGLCTVSAILLLFAKPPAPPTPAQLIGAV